ncbi:MAG: winged helix-turn-helix transcriptional regulator [Chloroflexi bacterium]|uniref:Winged helix-turn-helix transcriptional regulator n=1 Tax=Candidatus Chlorohelix allophototropha TaxID=3003348 RepID=A0A8T7M9I7_9CHLR|nr:winged helix-turn-helix transcriptional regulator [Chloroflexota bacterium]WJW68716.1 MarR family winged helix-turn-helix transcriptional regulator [Chloroflexota bacterium L227-S17]
MNKTETPPEFARIQCACTNLKMASRVVGRAYDAFLAPFDLNVTQYAILVNVSRYQPVSQMKLAAHLNLERTTLYREVAPLAKKKWLKISATSKGVTKTLELTPSGQEVVKQAIVEWEKIQNGFTDNFGKERWNEFLTTLEEIREYFSFRNLGVPL